MPWPSLSRSAAAALCVAVVAGPAVVGPAHASAAYDRVPGPRTAEQAGVQPRLRPVAPDVTRHRITSGTTVARTAGSGRSQVALTPAYRVSGYATVGVTWHPSARLGTSAMQVRILADGSWSGWEPLEYEADHGPDADTAEGLGTIPGTEPLLVGEAERVQVRVSSATGSLPRGLSLAVIDPGTSSADATPTVPTTSEDTGTAAALASTAVPRPTIYSRAQWGADESLRSGDPRYGSVQTTFVHHTVNANDYTADQVPAILRSIYAYHTVGRGWSDIGYNVLVDRFGKLWEGRYGGLEANVVGAHTLKYNEEAFGVSVIGNFEVVQPSAALLDGLAEVLAWKLDMAGLPATGSTQVDGATFQMINGHRDAASTACPGRYLYAQVPTVRTRTAALIAGAPSAPPAAGVLRRSANADSRPDVVVREDGAVRSMLGDAGPGFLPAVGPGSKAGRLDTVTGVGDLDGDARGDVLVRYRSDGVFQVRSSDGEGGFSTILHNGSTRFATATAVVGAPDLTGDDLHDLIVREADGTVRVAAGQGPGFGVSRTVSASWSTHRAVLGAGDLDGDGVGDLLVVDEGGVLWSVRGLNDLRFAAPVRLGGGWDARQNLVAGMDLTGDHRPDLMATDVATGLTWIRPGTSTGGFGLPIGGWTGWQDAMAVTATSDATGDRFADAVVVDAEGRMSLRPSRHGMWLRPGGTTTGDWSTYRWLRLVGDWDGDGRGDLVGVEGDRLWIFRGRGNGTFQPRTGGWTGWSERKHLMAVGDWSGDGRPDLMSRTRDGSLWLHRGRSDAGVGEPLLLRVGGKPSGKMTAVGLWNRDGRPDLVSSTSDGQLLLWPGTATKALGAPVTLAGGFGPRRYDQLIGAGDLTGDGRPDLLVRSRRAGTALILPGSVGGVGTPVRVAGGWGRYTMIG